MGLFSKNKRPKPFVEQRKMFQTKRHYVIFIAHYKGHSTLVNNTDTNLPYEVKEAIIDRLKSEGVSNIDVHSEFVFPIQFYPEIIEADIDKQNPLYIYNTNREFLAAVSKYLNRGDNNARFVIGSGFWVLPESNTLFYFEPILT